MLFQTLHDLPLERINEMVDALYRQEHVALLVDPSGVFFVLIATPAQPYEVDFKLVKSLETMEPQGVNPTEYRVLYKWAHKLIGSVCRRWKKRHPDSAHEEIS